MSGEAKEFLESIKQPEQSIGAVEAAVEGVSAFLSQMKEIGGAVGMGPNPSSATAALRPRRHSSAPTKRLRHVRALPRASSCEGQEQVPDHGLPPIEAVKQPEVQQPEIKQEQDRGGMSM